MHVNLGAIALIAGCFTPQSRRFPEQREEGQRPDSSSVAVDAAAEPPPASPPPTPEQLSERLFDTSSLTPYIAGGVAVVDVETGIVTSFCRGEVLEKVTTWNVQLSRQRVAPICRADPEFIACASVAPGAVGSMALGLLFTRATGSLVGVAIDLDASSRDEALTNRLMLRLRQSVSDLKC